MGLFRRARKRRAEADAQDGEAQPTTPSKGAAEAEAAHDGPADSGGVGDTSSRAAADHAPAATPTVLNPTALRDALQELCAQRPSREVFAEQALHVFARSGSIKAAALLGYEARSNRLSPLSSVGLDAPALELLNGDNRSQTWDIPLRVITNKRISVIQAAHENPFVPQAFVALSPRRLAIAVLPFYHAQSPVGVLVLFSPTHRGLADGMLQAISNALRICAAALTQLPSADTPSRLAEDAQQPALLRGLKVLKAQLGQLQQSLDEAERQRATEAAERVTAESFLRAERERLNALEQELAVARSAQVQVPTLEARIADLTEQHGQILEAAATAQVEVQRLQAEAAAADEQAREQASLVAALTTAEAELRQELSAALRLADERASAVAETETTLGELRVRSRAADELQHALQDAKSARAAADSELTQLRKALASAQAAHAEAEAGAAKAEQTARSLSAELADARQYVAQLEAQAAAAGELRQQVAALEAVREQLHGTKREHHEAERDWATRSAQLTAERDQLQAEMLRLREQSGSTVADLHERLERIERERVEVGERLHRLGQADAERQTLQHRVEELEQDLVAAHETLRAQEARVRDLSDQSARLIAERRELHGRIEVLTAGGHTLEKEKQQALNNAQRRVTEVEEQLNRLAAELEAARSAASDELNHARAAADQELRSLRAGLADTQRARDALQHELAQRHDALLAASQEVTAVGGERNRLRDELDRAVKQQSTLHADTQHLRAAHAERDQRIAGLENALREAHEAKAAAVAEMNEEISALFGRIDALEHERVSERDRLLQSLADKDLLLQAAEDGLTEEVAGSEMELESMLAIDRSGTPADEGVEVVAEEDIALEIETATAPDEMLVIEGAEAASALGAQLASYGRPTFGVTPGEGMLARIEGHHFVQAAINLSTPSAWIAVRALRATPARVEVPFFAYALAPGAPSGFWLGAVDFAVLPLAENALPTVLARLAPRARRVIGMSNDIDVMGDVRTQLSARGVSTAVVLDGRQALDLVPTVRPEAAILHLSPRCVDVFRAVAGLRSNEAAKNIPILFLLDTTPQPQEETFLAAGLRMLATRANLKASELLNLLASSVDAKAALSPIGAKPSPRGQQQNMRLAG